MPLARFLSFDDFQAAPWGALAAVLRVPLTAREYLAERLPPLHLLLTGLEPEQSRTLRRLRESAEVPGVELYPQLVLGDRDRAPGTALLSGRLEQLDRLARALAPDELGRCLTRALGERPRDARPRWKVGATLLPARTAVMGVVNVTPDSCSDGGRVLDPAAAIAHGLQLAAEGADLLDIGGESTRPGGGVYGAGMSEVSAAEEIARVVPVLAGLSRQCPLPLSVDTRKAEVARAALGAGAVVVNDISGLTHDPGLARVAAQGGASLCLMHSKGSLGNMQVQPQYEDLLGEVAVFLAAGVSRAREAGVEPERICVDPGLGFGKTVEHNLALLQRLPALAALGYPVLVGASRKSFLGKLTGNPLPSERLQASVAAAVAAAMRGAAVVRAHDVRATVQALRVVDALLGS